LIALGHSSQVSRCSLWAERVRASTSQGLLPLCVLRSTCLSKGTYPEPSTIYSFLRCWREPTRSWRMHPHFERLAQERCGYPRLNYWLSQVSGKHQNHTNSMWSGGPLSPRHMSANVSAPERKRVQSKDVKRNP